MARERQLPSQHEAKRLSEDREAEKAREKARKEEARLLAAVDWLLKQENGRVVMAWLFHRCGYNKSVLLRVAGGDVAPLSTEAAAAQREVYRDFRRLASGFPELLMKAEFEAEFGTKDEGIEKEKGGADA